MFHQESIDEWLLPFCDTTVSLMNVRCLFHVNFCCLFKLNKLSLNLGSLSIKPQVLSCDIFGCCRPGLKCCQRWSLDVWDGFEPEVTMSGVWIKLKMIFLSANSWYFLESDMYVWKQFIFICGKIVLWNFLQWWNFVCEIFFNLWFTVSELFLDWW